MGVEGCYKCMKYVLVGFNILVLIIGALVLGLGIYTLVTDYGVEQMSYIIGSNLYKAGTYMLIIVGSATVLISFLGCCGAAMESRFLLGCYFAIMLILTILFLAIVVIGFVFKKDIEEHLKDEASTSLIYKYGSDQHVTAQWDSLQAQLKCCGVTGDVNSKTSWAIYKLSSDWYMNQMNDASKKEEYVPASCCPPEHTYECRNNNKTIPVMGPGANLPTMENNTLLYTEGCYDKVDDFLETNALIIGGIALAGLFVMILGVIFSICLCAQLGNRGYVV